MASNTQDITRKLAAILFADIQGYTALMQKDEEQASLMLRRFQDQLRNTVSANQGKIVNFYGDGALCTFDTPSEAVRCAIDLQMEFQKGKTIPVRIGVHSGTVVLENDKVYGDSVNIASRIESLGVAGAVLVSKSVRDQVKNKPEFQLTPVGKHSFKNVEETMMIYALANEGLTVPRSLGKKSNTPSRKIFVIASLGILILALYFILKPFLFSDRAQNVFDQGSFIDDAQIAIEVFDNNSLSKEHDLIGKMAADWITHGIVQNQIAPVISYETIDQYEGVTKAGLDFDQILNAFKGDVKIIKGEYYVVDSNVIFQCAVLDQKTKKPLHAFKDVKCHLRNPLTGIEQLKDQILGYWVTRDLQSNITTPPTYTAYKDYLRAKEYWSDNYVLADSFIRSSLSSDPNFVNAKVLLAALNYNTQDYDQVDSVIRSMDQDIVINNPYQANTIDHYQALLDGNSRRVFETYQKEYNSAPKDLFTNTAMMVIALTFVNKPELVKEIYNELDNEILDYANCSYCMVRKEILAESLIKMGEYAEAIDLLEPMLPISMKRQPREYLIKAYVRSQKFDRLDQMLFNEERKALTRNREYLYFLAAHNSQLTNQPEMVTKYGNQAIQLYQSQDKPNLKMMGRTYFVMEDYSASGTALEKYISDYPNDIFSLGKLAAIAFINGDPQKADEYIKRIQSINRSNDFGYTPYMIAQAYVFDKQYSEVYKYLKQSIQAGHRFALVNFNNDPVFRDLNHTAEWIEIVDYWK